MTDDLKDRRFLLGVTGCIGAYKAADITSKLVQRGALVTVVMTRSATKFITPLTFESISRRPVFVDMFDDQRDFNPHHVALGEWAEVAVIAPATANIIAKIAHGIADDLLSTTLLCVDCPIVIAPAMNSRMWDHRVTQANVKLVKDLGCHIVEPAEGYLACGSLGVGRLADTQEIIRVAVSLLK